MGFLTARVSSSYVPESSRSNGRSYIGMSGSGDCRRSIFLDKKIHRGKDDFLSNLRFKDGFMGEKLMLDLIKGSGIKITDTQLELVDPEIPQVRGHIDGVIWEDEIPILLELKRMHHDGFVSLTNAQSLRVTHPKYYDQVVVYLWNLRVSKYPQMEKAIIWVQNKNRHTFYEEEIFPDDERVGELREKFRDIVHHLATKGLPVRDHNPFQDRECIYCPYKDPCISLGESRRDFLSIEELKAYL